MFQVIEFSPAAIAAYIAMVGILSIVAQVRDVCRSDFFAVVGRSEESGPGFRSFFMCSDTLKKVLQRSEVVADFRRIFFPGVVIR